MTTIVDRINSAAPRNKELLSILSETDHAPPALEQQKRFVADLNNELSQVQSRIRALERKRDKELKDHEKYRDSVMKRFAYKATGQKEKFAAKAVKEEEEYFEVLQDCHKAKDQEENIKAMRAEALSVQSDLEAQTARHVQAQSELDSLYDGLFRGPTPAFPEEDNSEAKTEGALRLYHDARVKLESEQQAENILQNADKRLKAALSHMEDALDHSRMDMFGGGSISDMMEREALHNAESQMNQLQMLVMQAQRMSPHVQDLPTATIQKGNLMSDVFFDNIFSDAAFHDKIKQSRDEVRRVGAALDRQRSLAQSRRQECDREMKTQTDLLNAARVELQKARERIFERIENNEAPPPPPKTTTQADDPPPAYS